MILPGVVVVVRNLPWVVAGERGGTDQDRAKESVQAVVAVRRIVEKRHGVIGIANLALNGAPVLIWFLFTVGMAFKNRTRDLREYLRLAQRSWNLELKHLLLLAPVDDKSQFKKIDTGKLGNIENNLRTIRN